MLAQLDIHLEHQRVDNEQLTEMRLHAWLELIEDFISVTDIDDMSRHTRKRRNLRACNRDDVDTALGGHLHQLHNADRRARFRDDDEQVVFTGVLGLAQLGLDLLRSECANTQAV